MKKRIFFILIAVLVLSIILTPLVAATPGAQQSNNEKWQSIEIRIFGMYDEGKTWQTPPEPAIPKTSHERDGEWRTDTVLSLTVTIDGTEVYSLISSPISLGYYALGAGDYNIGKSTSIRIKESIKFMDGTTELGTLEIRVSSHVKDNNWVDARGTFSGVGTGALKGVQVVGTDSFDMATFEVVRMGIVKNWPGLP